MVKPLSQQEQMKERYFEPNRKLAVYFATSKFDSVWRIDEEDGKAVQFLDDLEQCAEDCRIMRLALKKY